MLSRAVAAMLPIVPVPIVERVSRRYIAGTTLEAAVEKVRWLNGQGYLATMDLLGEDVTTEAEAEAMTQGYLGVLAAIAGEGLRSNVSIKPTNHGILIDPALAEANIRRIVEAAGRDGNYVRMDMESSAVTQITLDVYRRVLADHDNVGIVLQAYLHRSLDDARALVELNATRPVTVRLCKGIYREPRAIAWRRKRAIRDSYLELTRVLIEGGVYVGLATHDRYLLRALEAWLDARQTPKTAYEFQALLGVPITDVLNRYVSEDRAVRLYVPFGENWYGYSVRRLRENPKMAGHVFKAMFRRTRYEE